MNFTGQSDSTGGLGERDDGSARDDDKGRRPSDGPLDSACAGDGASGAEKVRKEEAIPTDQFVELIEQQCGVPIVLQLATDEANAAAFSEGPGPVGMQEVTHDVFRIKFGHAIDDPKWNIEKVMTPCGTDAKFYSPTIWRSGRTSRRRRSQRCWTGSPAGHSGSTTITRCGHSRSGPRS